MAETLLLSAAFAVVIAIVYGFVGQTIRRRRVAETNLLANYMFATWWYGLALYTAIFGAQALLTYANQTDLALHVTLTLVNVFLICIALMGLLFYLIFLFTGSRRTLRPLIVLYAAFFFVLVFWVLQREPVGVREGAWGSEIVYQSGPGGLFFVTILLFLLLPQILGAIALFVLTFRVKDREQKFRTAVVSWSIIIWFGASLVANLAQLSTNLTWQVTSRFIGLGAAVAILLAYRPPHFLRRWFALSVGGFGPAVNVRENAAVVATGLPRALRSNPVETAS